MPSIAFLPILQSCSWSCTAFPHVILMQSLLPSSPASFWTKRFHFNRVWSDVCKSNVVSYKVFDITFNASSMQPDEMSTINSLIWISKPKSKWMLCFLNFFSSSTLVCSRVSISFLICFQSLLFRSIQAKKLYIVKSVFLMAYFCKVTFSPIEKLFSRGLNLPVLEHFDHTLQIWVQCSSHSYRFQFTLRELFTSR